MKMAFKLVGDQKAGSHLLRKRRVTQLLADNIPSDEALLMKNGRYACLVCKNRPTFDTIGMLSIHRSGKKHLAATSLCGEKPWKQKRPEQELHDTPPLLHHSYRVSQHIAVSSMDHHTLCTFDKKKDELCSDKDFSHRKQKHSHEIPQDKGTARSDLCSTSGSHIVPLSTPPLFSKDSYSKQEQSLIKGLHFQKQQTYHQKTEEDSELQQTAKRRKVSYLHM